MKDLSKKILGSLTMAAIGDTMGSATENLPHSVILEKFNGGLTEFVKPDKTAFAYGNEIGEVTDDFSQIYYISKNVCENNGIIDFETIKKSIIMWSNIPRFFNRFAGPSTRSAIEMYKTNSEDIKPLNGATVPDYASKATNGAAMKISPAGLFNYKNINKAIEDSIIITRVTHDNHLAISGAAAVAAAVCASLEENASVESIIEAGLYGAKLGEEKGKEISRYVAGASVIERTKLALEIVELDLSKEEKLQKLYDVVGSGLHISESVPCAFGLIALNKEDPYQAVIDAVNIGYDTDTIATIVGAIVGGIIDIEKHLDMLYTIEKANNFDIQRLANDITKYALKNFETLKN